MNSSFYGIDASSGPYGVLILRVALAAMWISHALTKYFVFTIPGFGRYLTSVGFPSELAWPVFLMELIGGLMILLGIYARHVALVLVPVIAAAASVHIGNGWVFTNPKGGWEYPVFLLVSCFALWLLGDGAFALRSRPLFFFGSPRLARA
jgi:putative oxidoreductase